MKSRANKRSPSQNRTSSVSKPETEVKHLPTSDIRPSPENEKLYRPVSLDDPEIVAMAASIQRLGIKEPLVITRDNFILSGHRRHAGARLAGLKVLPCRVEPIDREAEPDRFMVLLREYNRQREKSFDEKVREICVSLNPARAHESLIAHRELKSSLTAKTLFIRNIKTRSAISDARKPFLHEIAKVLGELRPYWPVSLRQVHYNLLNNPPLTHASKRGSRYKNNLKCYSALSDLATRARLEGLIPSGSIGDETRPITIAQCWREPGIFISEQCDSLLTGYYRDTMQSQPNHVEILVEKNTAANSVQRVALEYRIPMTSGRGFCSLPPRQAMAKRFQDSGKEKLVLIILSDFDPSGEEIAHSFARSMRDDFGIENVSAIRAGLTLEQVNTMTHPSQPGAILLHNEARSQGPIWRDVTNRQDF